MKQLRKARLILLVVSALCAPMGVRAGGPQGAALAPTPTASASTDADPLDFEVFKSEVEPIFLKERPGHARCYGCHILPNRGFHLETLSPGSTEWNDYQSQLNFQHVLQHVVPGDPTS